MATLTTTTAAQPQERSNQATTASTPSAQSLIATNVEMGNGEQVRLVMMAILMTTMDVITTVRSILDGHVILDSVFLKPRIICLLLSVTSVETANGRLESNVTMGTRRDVILVVRLCLRMCVIQGLI